jgi:biotin carboxylase
VPRVLLLLPTTTYRAADFLSAASSLRADVVVASEEPSALEGLNPSGLLTLDFRDPAACAREALEFSRRHPIDAVVGVDEETAVAAAAISDALELPHNAVEAAEAAADKGRMRELLARGGARSPSFRVVGATEDPRGAAASTAYPCVLKPTFLSGSRGVIRANDSEQFVAAWGRILAILREPDVSRRGGAKAGRILVEDFVPGIEVALEGILTGGRLRTLALFDKPDPLNGPFFEETIYVTPSRLSRDVQAAIEEETACGARALGLAHGPVHAELRWNDRGAWIVELAARTIGGLCSRTLRFGAGVRLEELVVRQALGQDVADLRRDERASAVMMIPIPGKGVYETVEGLEEARRVAAIEEITISARPGQTLVPLPEGSRYLGFIFSRAETPEAAEAAVREAHRRLRFRIQ